MKIFQQITVIGSLLSIISFYAYAMDSAENKKQFDAYLEKLLVEEKKGGRLYCEYESVGKREDFNSCESFLLLKKKGCFGYTTYEMSMESRYSELCKELDLLKDAKSATTNYFKINSDDWWKNIPAEVIPMPGGIYSDSSWERAKAAREKLVKKKFLGEIAFAKLSVTKESLEAVISISKEECGEIEDYLKISIVQIADFNSDDVAELLLKGYRIERSDTCSLGSGNSLGAGFSALVQKKSATEAPTVINQNME